VRSFSLSQAREVNYPEAFQEVAQLIGEAATAKLTEQYGGTRLYIPSTLKPEHSLCQLLGKEAAQRLSFEFGGLRVEIPRAVMLQIAQRNVRILADRATGLSQRELARKYQLTERTIRKITTSTSNTI